MRPRILVVEDAASVIMSLEEVFEELGWDMIGPATTVAEARHLALGENLDAALLDVNLDGKMSWPVASILVTRGVPFAFATGYDAKTVLPEAFRSALVVGKPYSMKEVELRLRGLLSASR